MTDLEFELINGAQEKFKTFDEDKFNWQSFYTGWIEGKKDYLYKKDEVLKIRIREWDYTCADGCCYDYGQDLYINNLLITNYFEGEGSLKSVLTFLGFKFEIEFDISNI